MKKKMMIKKIKMMRKKRILELNKRKRRYEKVQKGS